MVLVICYLCKKQTAAVILPGNKLNLYVIYVIAIYVEMNNVEATELTCQQFHQAEGKLH